MRRDGFVHGGCFLVSWAVFPGPALCRARPAVIYPFLEMCLCMSHGLFSPVKSKVVQALSDYNK